MAEPPLIEAAMSGNVATVKNWLDAGVDINQKDSNGDTALVWAAWEGRLEVVRLLLERGADRTLARAPEFTPQLLAEKKNRPDIVKLLTAGRPPTQIPIPRPPAAGESWARMGEKTVAQVGVYPEIQRKLTTIFNFESRERLIIAENTATRTESFAPPTCLDELPRSLVEKALAEFTRLGGTADRDFVLDGENRMIKPRRELSPK